MKVAIDILPALNRKKTGIGRYTLELVRALDQINNEIDYHLYFLSLKQSEKAVKKYLNVSMNVHKITFPNLPVDWLKNYIFYDKLLPSALESDGIQLYHSTNMLGIPGEPVMLVSTIHDVAFHYFPDGKEKAELKFLNQRIPLLIEKSHKIIAISHSTKTDLINLYGCPEEKVEVIHHGLPDSFVVSETAGRKYDFPYLLNVGTIIPRKNHITLIRAFLKARQQGKIPHKLVIAGAGSFFSPEVVKLVTKLKLEKHVIFAEYLSYRELKSLYTYADLFVFPSLYEGFGFPVLEAMACGCPVIAADNSSLPEVCGDAAVQVPAEDENKIAEAILDLVNSKQKWEEFRQKGYQQVKKFSWKENAKKTVSLYKTLAAG